MEATTVLDLGFRESRRGLGHPTGRLASQAPPDPPPPPNALTPPKARAPHHRFRRAETGASQADARSKAALAALRGPSSAGSEQTVSTPEIWRRPKSARAPKFCALVQTGMRALG